MVRLPLVTTWCDCTLKVSGSLTELDRFSKQASGPDSCLDPNQFAPYPKIFDILDKNISSLNNNNMSDEEMGILTLARLKGLDITKDGYNQGGFDWYIDNWGFSTEIHPSLLWKKRTIRYSFNTMSSPAKLVKVMGKQFPKLSFSLEYIEASTGFHGKLKIARGEVTSEREKG